MKDPKRINRILKLIKKIWTKHPDYRLLQLLINCYGVNSKDHYYIEDTDLEFLLRSVYIKEVNSGNKKRGKI